MSKFASPPSSPIGDSNCIHDLQHISQITSSNSPKYPKLTLVTLLLAFIVVKAAPTQLPGMHDCRRRIVAAPFPRRVVTLLLSVLLLSWRNSLALMTRLLLQRCKYLVDDGAKDGDAAGIGPHIMGLLAMSLSMMRLQTRTVPTMEATYATARE